MPAHPDLPAYFGRIGYTGPRDPTLAVLRELCTRHLNEIPFESLDPFLGIPVDLDPAALQAKLIEGCLGGYCQEHNAVFHDVLAAMGFSVSALGARVVWAFKEQRAPLTHRLTLVELAGGKFIVDVGFGGFSPTEPLRLVPGIEQATPHGTYRLVREHDVFELQLRYEDSWDAMYQFDLAPQARIDFEVANWFTSTHPRALFTQNLIVCRVVGKTRINLWNANLSIRQSDGRVEQRVLADAADLRQVLGDVMGLHLPASAETIWARVERNLRDASPAVDMTR